MNEQMGVMIGVGIVILAVVYIFASEIQKSIERRRFPDKDKPKVNPGPTPLIPTGRGYMVDSSFVEGEIDFLDNEEDDIESECEIAKEYGCCGCISDEEDIEEVLEEPVPISEDELSSQMYGVDNNPESVISSVKNIDTTVIGYSMVTDPEPMCTICNDTGNEVGNTSGLSDMGTSVSDYDSSSSYDSSDSSCDDSEW